MQLRHLPRSKSGTKYHAPNPGRPVAMNDMPLRHEFEQKFYPDGVERVPNCIADYSIPTIDQVVQKIGNTVSSQLGHLLENQMVLEKLAWAETDNSDESLGHAQESEPPPVCNEFQAARLFLSHFGFLSMDEQPNGENMEAMSPVPLLTVLDATKPGFLNDLQSLDKLSPRTNDTLHAFYVKVGQTTAAEIVENVSEENASSLNKSFWNVLLSLGWPVDIDTHSGWTGSAKTSWRIHNEQPMQSRSEVNLGAAENLKFNGEKRVLYWADVSSEIAFIVPTRWNRSEDSADGGCMSISSVSSIESEKSQPRCDRSVSLNPCPAVDRVVTKPRTLSLELDKPKPTQPSSITSTGDPIAPTRRRTCVKSALMCNSNAKLLMVWLESFEDHLTFPVDDLLAYTRTGEEFQNGQIPRATDCYIIFLHSLNSGLLRIKLQGPQGRMNFASPLIDGMVVSKRVVGTLIRQTVLNMAKRRRLDNDL